MTDAELLKAYKDTGLEPEDVRDMMTDWVVWKEAEAGGRLIVLPSTLDTETREWLRGAFERLIRVAEAALGGADNAKDL